jgi:Xaa-Pro dipeptidase
VEEVMRAHAGDNRRLAVDKIMVHGLRALERAGFEVLEGEVVTERARAVKGPDEIRAMRCAHHACEAAIAEMEAFARAEVPEGRRLRGRHLGRAPQGQHPPRRRMDRDAASRLRPRTNPWFQECGPRIVQENEIVAFDTDLIGATASASTSAAPGGSATPRPTNAMVSAMHHAMDHIREHGDAEARRHDPRADLRRPPAGDRYWRRNTPARCMAWGSATNGPSSPTPTAGWTAPSTTALEPGMVLCVEALVSPEGGDFSIKLEEQVLITETGHENLTRYPFDPRLAGRGANSPTPPSPRTRTTSWRRRTRWRRAGSRRAS